MKTYVNEIYFNSTNKEGKSLVDKNGKPYVRIVLVNEGKKYSYLSYNEDDRERGIEKGQTIEIMTEKNGDFLNFKLFDKQKAEEKLKYYEQEVEKLKKALYPNSTRPIEEINAEVDKDIEAIRERPTYEKPMSVDQVPF